MTEKIQHLSKNLYVPVALLAFMLSTGIYLHNDAAGVNVRIAQLETELASHQGNPSVHERIVDKLELNYVARPELDSRFSSIERTLSEVKADVKAILERLNDK
jgi:hypothetical protein